MGTVKLIRISITAYYKYCQPATLWFTIFPFLRNHTYPLLQNRQQCLPDSQLFSLPLSSSSMYLLAAKLVTQKQPNKVQHTNLLSGTVASGSSLSHYVTLPPPTPTGTLISVPGFTPEVNGTVVFGTDHLYTDPDGSKFRVNVSCIVKYICELISTEYHY